MSFKFGFEVEGFYLKGGKIEIPPKEYTHDDFPGLVEVRNTGGGNLREQFYLLKSSMDEYENVDWSTTEYTFTPKQKTIIRGRHYEKGGVHINNIYGKSPKELGSKTLASFQINISSSNGMIKDSYGSMREQYSLFDFVTIIRNLDEEFEKEIKESKRQIGFYSIKDHLRLEYRSLPNSVVTQNTNKLLKRIEGCVK